MAVSLDKLIMTNRPTLVDGITKDAIRQIPSYGKPLLGQTVERVERWLDALAKSIGQNDPHILEQHLTAVANERRQEGFAVSELHAIVEITEQQLQEIIARSGGSEVEQNALSALLRAVMDAARMILSVTYVLMASAS